VCSAGLFCGVFYLFSSLACFINLFFYETSCFIKMMNFVEKEKNMLKFVKIVNFCFLKVL